MRDCLVETNCWGKCDEEVERFQQCINTRYFQEDEQPPVQESSGENDELEVENNERSEFEDEDTTMKFNSTGELTNEEILKNEEELIVEIKEKEKEEDSISKVKDE